MSFRERKQQRIEYFLNHVFGWRLRKCTACDGTGRFDNTGSPKCTACNGTGKERYPGPKAIKNERQG